MNKVILSVTMSLDGYIAGPHDQPDLLHDWFFRHFSGASTGNGKVIDELIQTTGAIMMGRRTYNLADTEDGFVENPFLVPHFVLTHEAPEKGAKGTTPFIFITNGIENALKQAKVAAGKKNVIVMGGADIAQQCIKAGLLDEIQIHLVPVFLGGGIRLLDHLHLEPISLERIRIIEAYGVIHLRFRVVPFNQDTCLNDTNREAGSLFSKEQAFFDVDEDIPSINIPSNVPLTAFIFFDKE